MLRKIFRWLLVLLLAMLLAAIIFWGPIRNSFLSVRAIQVQGAERISRGDIIEATGIQIGKDSIWDIDDEALARNVNSNPHLKYVGAHKDYVSRTLYLTVSEHPTQAKILSMGQLILISDVGVVLLVTSDIDIAAYVPEIVGVTVSDVRVGQPVSYAVTGQGEAVERLLTSLNAQSFTGEIAEINIAQPDSISLTTHSGLQIMLGNDENLPVKMALIRDTYSLIPSYGEYDGAVLDVSSAKTADYRPR